MIGLRDTRFGNIQHPRINIHTNTLSIFGRLIINASRNDIKAVKIAIAGIKIHQEVSTIMESLKIIMKDKSIDELDRFLSAEKILKIQGNITAFKMLISEFIGTHGSYNGTDRQFNVLLRELLKNQASQNEMYKRLITKELKEATPFQNDVARTSLEAFIKEIDLPAVIHPIPVPTLPQRAYSKLEDAGSAVKRAWNHPSNGMKTSVAIALFVAGVLYNQMNASTPDHSHAERQIALLEHINGTLAEFVAQYPQYASTAIAQISEVVSKSLNKT